SLTRGYDSAAEFYIQRMSEAISDFAASWPEGVVNVRVPDLGSDNHLGLIGAPPEVHGASPMLGWRGTSLLIAADYAPAFDLDCEILRRVVDVNGFANVQVLVPFCRTPTDGAEIYRRIRERTSPKLRVGMMVEIPANAVLGRAFAEIFDFFLVGPMDLTQLVYGADRLSTRTADYCQETEAVKELVKVFLERIAHAGKDVYIGGWPLYQHAAEYHQLKTNNRIHLVELPDRILELFDRVAALERNHGEELFT
ncbi:MAG: hypothetical protein KC457_08315, partial [Myxococcales bacterium]|nr:hypothetical protein [Myxococcales bacterium]